MSPDLREERKGRRRGRERERERKGGDAREKKHLWFAFPVCPDWGKNPQCRYVPGWNRTRNVFGVWDNPPTN